MKIIDSHNHIHFREFQRDRKDVMERAAEGGVIGMLAVGIDPKDCRKALDHAQHHKGVFVSVGIHPQNALRYGPEDAGRLADLCRDESVVAIGETGFDLYRTPGSEVAQRALFIAHIDLARQVGLPLVIHDRSAHEQTLRVLDDARAWSVGGVFHCFSGDAAMAQEVTGKGFFISIPGVVTFRNAAVLKEVVGSTPLEWLLVETDAPYLTPEPFRGRRNEPIHVAKTVEEIARIKDVSPEEVAGRTTENFKRLFLARVSQDRKDELGV